MLLNELFDNPGKTELHHFERSKYYTPEPDEFTWHFLVHKKTGKILPGRWFCEYQAFQTKEVKQLKKEKREIGKEIDKIDQQKHAQWRAQEARGAVKHQGSKEEREEEIKLGKQSYELGVKFAKKKIAIEEIRINLWNENKEKEWMHYEVTVDPINDKDKLPTNSPDEDNTYSQFNLPKEGLYDFHFRSSEEEDGKTKLTGTGHSVRIMSTILSVLKQALAQPQVKHIITTAFKNEPSRIKLYDKVLKNIAKKRWEHNGAVYWLL